MPPQKNSKEPVSGENRLTEDDIELLACFFDLLAQFDFEDKKFEQSVLKTGPAVSAPEGSVLGSDDRSQRN